MNRHMWGPNGYCLLCKVALTAEAVSTQCSSDALATEDPPKKEHTYIKEPPVNRANLDEHSPWL